MQVDISLDYLRSILKVDQQAFNDIINKELPKGYKTKFSLSELKVSQTSPDQFDISIPGVISLFSQYRGHESFEWQPSIVRTEVSTAEPHYYKYSLKGHSKVSFLKKGGCVHQLQEGCERVEKLLENFVNVMFGKWEYPLWEPVSGLGKITKYNIWYLMMMSGEVNVNKNEIMFKSSNADIGFEEKYRVHKIPESSNNKAVRLFLDKDMIDATLK